MAASIKKKLRRKALSSAARQSPLDTATQSGDATRGASNDTNALLSDTNNQTSSASSMTPTAQFYFDSTKGWCYGVKSPASHFDAGAPTSASSASTQTSKAHKIFGVVNYAIPLGPPDDFTPLRFKLKDRLSNVDVSEDGLIARYKRSSSEELNNEAVSARPIRINELVCFRILENATNSGVFINFGVINYTDTDRRHFRNHKLDCRTYPLHSTHNKRGTIVSFYVNSRGNLYYDVNGQEKLVDNYVVNTTSPIWAVIKFFGNGAVHLVPNPGSVENQRVSPIQHHSAGDPVSQSTSQDTLLPLNLHTIKANAQISSGVITRNQMDIPQAYVFSANPMCPGQTVAVQILSTVTGYPENFAYGLTSCNPSTIRPCELPDEAYFLHDRPEYWTVHKAEGDLKVLDQVMFTLTSDGRVQERQNNSSPKTVMHVDATQTLWAFVNVSGAVQKVRLLTCIGAVPTLPRLIEPEPSSNLPQPREHPDTTTAAKEDLDSVDTECKVCFDNTVDSALYKCGHACMCYNCALQLLHDGGGKCPLCRARIVDVIRIFKS